VSILWPRLPEPVASKIYGALDLSAPVHPNASHPEQIYAPVGGRRATESEIRTLIEDVTEIGTTHGFPDTASDRQRISFDRDVARIVRARMDLSWAEAGNRDMWSFTALVALPNLTWWRFGTRNRERWLATDLTRHTWARLWWQATVFETDPELLQMLTESDLNQLLERRSIGGDPRLVCALGRAVIECGSTGLDRRTLIRDTTARLRRLLAFVDPRATTDDQLLWMCRYITGECVRHHVR
jgi:hypothetical protein